MKKFIIILGAALVLIAAGCRTTDFDRLGTSSGTVREHDSARAEASANYEETQDWLVQERLKEVDVEKTVVYVDRPVYVPGGAGDMTGEGGKPALSGKAAVKESTENSLISPSRFTDGAMFYDFDDHFTYEIYCQPYRVTDLILQPGEQVIEMPFLSEEKVWEIGAGVSRTGGVDTQHFFLKPAYSGLITSFIIITDRRVYHLLLKSFKDVYMSQVKWDYPNTMPFKLSGDMGSVADVAGKAKTSTTSVDPRYLSFDYKMSYSIFKKPYWLPQRVYDDGRRTYISMDETVLHMTSPVLFNKNNERINYFVEGSLIVVNELVEKLTLRVGLEKVTITKKGYKEPMNIKVPEEPPKEVTLNADPALPPPPERQSSSRNFNSVYNNRLERETMIHNGDVIFENFRLFGGDPEHEE